MSQKGRLRAQMPIVAAFVDALRAEGYGPDVDAAQRNAMAGGCDFYAEEAGQVFGKPYRPSTERSAASTSFGVAGKARRNHE